MSTGNGAYFTDVDFVTRRHAHTWRPLKQINLAHLGPADGAALCGTVSKYALSTTIVVEGRHHEEVQKTRQIVNNVRMGSQLGVLLTKKFRVQSKCAELRPLRRAETPAPS